MCEYCRKNDSTYNYKVETVGSGISNTMPVITSVSVTCSSDNTWHLFVNGNKTCQCGKAKAETENNPPVPLYGWICTTCGKSNSPDTKQCPCLGTIGYGVINPGMTDPDWLKVKK